MKKFKLIVFTLFLMLFSMHLTADEYDEFQLNAFEKIYNQISGFIGLPAITLQSNNPTKQVLVIDYEQSYIESAKQIELYKEYVQCIVKSETLPMPVLRLLGKSDEYTDIIDAYVKYTERLLDYLINSRERCVPPIPVKLPVYLNYLNLNDF